MASHGGVSEGGVKKIDLAINACIHSCISNKVIFSILDPNSRFEACFLVIEQGILPPDLAYN